MFAPTAFRKITGVALDSDTATLEKGLAAAVRKTTASEIATALIVRTLVVEHGWKVGESAPAVGLSPSAAGVAGARGKVLWETGEDSAIIVWQTIRTLPSTALAALTEHLQTMTTEADRTEYVVRTGLRKVVTDRLGTNGTPERIDALTDAIAGDGHRTPVAAKGAVAGIAGRLEIPLPKAERKGSPEKAAGGTGADVPTFDAALRGVLAALTQAQDGADDDHPVEITPEQAALLDETVAALVAFADLAKVRVNA